MPLKAALRGCALAALPLTLSYQSAQAADPVGPAPAEWNLDGAGKLVLPENSPELVALGERLSARSVKVDVTVDAAGALTDCHAVAGENEAGVVPDLCAALLKVGKFERDPRFELPGNAHLVVSAFAARAYSPVMPVRFTKQGDETVRVFVAEEADGSCSVTSLSTRLGPDEVICAAWRAKGHPKAGRLYGGKFAWLDIPVDFGTVVGFEPLIGTDSIAQTGPTRSSLPDPEEALLLQPEDGQLQVALASGDYPTRASRDEIAGRIVAWLGFGRDGVARTCRPVESSNSAYLANASCDALLRKARFVFAEGAESYEGLRYAKAPIHWSLNGR